MHDLFFCLRCHGSVEVQREVRQIVFEALQAIKRDEFGTNECKYPRMDFLVMQCKQLLLHTSQTAYVMQTVAYLKAMLLSDAIDKEAELKCCQAPLPLVERFPLLGDSIAEVLTLVVSNLPMSSWHLLLHAAKLALKDVNGGEEVIKKLHIVDKKKDRLCHKSLSRLVAYEHSNADPRFNVARNVDVQQLTSASNKFVIGLWRLMKMNDMDVEMNSKKDVNIKEFKSSSSHTLLEISHAIHTKKLSKHRSPHPCVPLLHPLIVELEKFICNFAAFADTPLSFSDDDWHKLVRALQWKDRLQDLCSVPVSETEFRLFLPRLVLHWRYLHEELLKYILQRRLRCQTESAERLIRVIQKLNVIFSSKCGPIHELAETLAQHTDHPKPFPTKELADIQTRLIALGNDLKPNLDELARNVFLASEAGMKARSLFVSVAIDFCESKQNVATLSDRLSQLEQLKDSIVAENEIESQPQKFEVNFLHIQSWPLIDYIVSQKIHKAFLETTTKSGTRRELEILELGQHSMSIPLDVVESVHGQKSRFSSHLSSIIFSTTATRNPALWVTYFSDHKTGVEKDLKLKDAQNKVYSPVQCVLNLLLSAGTTAEALRQLRVGVHSVKSVQLYKIRETIWNFLSTLGDPSSSPKYLFAKTVEDFSKCFIASMSKVFKVETSSINEFVAAISVQLTENCGTDVSHLLEVMRSCFSAREDSGGSSATDLLLMSKIGCAAGALQGWIAGHMSAMDPALEKELLLLYTKQDVHKLRQEILQHSWNNILKGGKSLSEKYVSGNLPTSISDKSAVASDHPHLGIRLAELEKSTATVLNLTQEVAYRPEETKYLDLTQDVSQFFEHVFNPAIINDMMKKLCSEDVSFLTTAQIEGQLINFESFFNHITIKYPLFRDVTSLFLEGLSMTTYSMRVLISQTKMNLANKVLSSENNVTELLAKLTSFPVVRDPQKPLDHLPLVKDLVDVLSDMLLCYQERTSIAATPEALHKQHTSVNRKIQRLSLKATLLELYTAAVITGRLDWKASQVLGSLVDKALAWWRDQEEERKRKEDEEASLYKYKAKEHAKNETEDEQMTREFAETFPSYDKDFDDLNEAPLEQGKEKPEEKVEDFVEEWISMRELWEISEVHCDLLSKLPYSPHQECLPVNSNFSTIKNFGPIPGCLERVQVLQTVMNTAGPIADCDLDCATIGAHLIFNHTACKTWRDPQSMSILIKPQNFYIDPRPAEATKLRPLLMPLLCRVEQLLEQWPLNASLEDVSTVINRVLMFPIVSPVAKLLNGLQSILGKAEIWEENAHKGVSLGGDLTAETESGNLLVLIKRQIIEWRKMELHEWKNCLELVQYNEAVKSKMKWWPHLYDCLTKENWDNNPVSPVADILKELMNNSTLGDYETKLSLIYVFYRHLVLSGSNSSVIHVSLNIYRYFNQFVPFVKAALDKERIEIEKNIKETVKIANYSIATFRDINQVKLKVEKCCQALHQQMGLWKKLLNTQDKSLWAKDSGEDLKDHAEGSWDANREESCVVGTVPSPAVLHTENVLATATGSVLRSIKQYTAKAHALVNLMVASMPYSDCVEGIEGVTSAVITDYRELAVKTSLISNETDKEERKTKLKYILKLRRIGVTRLFKQLNDMGIKYQKGNTQWKDDKLSACYEIPTVDYDTLQLDSRVMKALEKVWPSTDKYFFRSVNRFTLMTDALAHPHGDLGPDIIRRMRGVTKHMMKTSVDVRKQMCSLAKNLHTLRRYLNDIECAPIEPLASMTTLQETWEKLYSFSLSLSLSASEVSAIMDTRIDKAIDTVYVENLHTSLVPSSQDSSLDQVHLTKVKSLLISVHTQCSKIAQKSGQMMAAFGDESWQRIVNTNHLELVGNLHQDLEEAAETLTSAVSLIDPKLSGHLCLTTQLIKWLTAWKTESLAIETWLQRVSAPESTDVGEMTPEPSEFIDVENCANAMLYAIQSLYKKHIGISYEDTNDVSFKDADDQVTLISNEAIEQLLSDIKSLKLNYVLTCVRTLVSNVSTGSRRQLQFSLNQISSLLQQYANLAENLLLDAVASSRSISKMLSVILAIFYQMALKGFCKAQDSDEQQQEGGKGQLSFDDDTEAAGLADGKGQKDMSDKLESEDQLEDALKEGEKEKPGDENLEEDDGVEMSQDFEGKLQDLDQPEQNESEDEDKQDDTHDQMGHTEEGAETLDKKLWNEKEDDENKDNEEQDDMEIDENAEGNEDEMESQIVAKEKDKKDQKNKKDDAQEKSDKPEEMEEDRRQPNKAPEDNDECENEFEDKHAGEDNKEQEEQNDVLDIPDDLNMDEPDEEKEAPEEGAEGDEEEQDMDQEANPFDIEKKSLFPEGQDINEDEDNKDDNEHKDGLDELPEELAQDKEDEEGNKNPDEMEETDQDFNADVVDEEEENKQEKEKKNAGLDAGDEPEDEKEKDEDKNEDDNKAEASKDKDTKTRAEAAEIDSKDCSKDKTKVRFAHFVGR